MDATVIKRFDTPDETRELIKGKFEVIHIGGLTIGRATYEPGWKWSPIGSLVRRRSGVNGVDCGSWGSEEGGS